MIFGTTAFQKTRAQELLTMKEMDLYQFYLTEIASEHVLAKSYRGKRACFGIWKRMLHKHAEATI